MSQPIFSNERFIAWLRQQPADKAYDFMRSEDCLIMQYLQAMGFHGGARYDLYNSGAHEQWVDVALPEPQTFGAALARAEKLLVKEDA